MHSAQLMTTMVAKIKRTEGQRTVLAALFCELLAANVDNPELSDEDFRSLVRATLPIVSYK